MSKKDILLLDCTLRDGGYVNDWEFDNEAVLKVSDALYDAGIRIIELGIMGRGGIAGKQTKFNDFSQIEPLLAQRKPDCHYSVIVTQEESAYFEFPCCTEKTVDYIRIAFFKQELQAAVKTARMLMDKGYKVFMQAMATSLYSENEFKTLMDEINGLKPYSYYIVDSFSTMYPEDVRYLTDKVLACLSKDILFGIHTHNNIQMAFSNVIEFIKTPTERPLVVDGSIFGMGRGAGNVPIELLMGYMNKRYGAEYDLRFILRVFEDVLEPIFNKFYWGYSLPNLLTAIKNMNSSYAWFLSTQTNLSLCDMSDIMDRIPEEERYKLNGSILDKIITICKTN